MARKGRSRTMRQKKKGGASTHGEESEYMTELDRLSVPLAQLKVGKSYELHLIDELASDDDLKLGKTSNLSKQPKIVTITYNGRKPVDEDEDVDEYEDLTKFEDESGKENSITYGEETYHSAGGFFFVEKTQGGRRKRKSRRLTRRKHY
jgi:hypothetical protein